MSVHFTLNDNVDNPADPDSWTYLGRRVEGRWATLSDALAAATDRAASLACDPTSDVYSVDVTMTLEEGGGGMEVAAVHVWLDHGVDRRWIAALREQVRSVDAPASAVLDGPR